VLNVLWPVWWYAEYFMIFLVIRDIQWIDELQAMYSLFTYEVFRLLVLVLYQSTLRSSTMPRLRMTLYKSADRLVSGEIQWSGRLTRPVRQFLYNANQAARCRNNYRRDENLTIVYMTELHVSTYSLLVRSARRRLRSRRGRTCF